ncbi:MAG: hypothetical protein EXR94_08260 [Gemmatimonadetes bacterium]|nr:hypothetical protein [Gemmatimonadota bacterium]
MKLSLLALLVFAPVGRLAAQPVPIPANTVTPFTVRGHRLMVPVQSTWFPLYDRNPQTYVPNIIEAKAGDFRAQTHRVDHGPKVPSHLAVGVVPD